MGILQLIRDIKNNRSLLLSSMFYQSRAGKRIRAIRRGPDGSAFQKCESCGVTVAIALADMHDCGHEKKTRKKQKIECRNEEAGREKIEDQPRSAFHFFMEEFRETCEDGNEMQRVKKGWEAWLNMSKQERLPFVRQADKLHDAYMKLLREEEKENAMRPVDDEADSSEVRKHKIRENCAIYWCDSESSGGSEMFLSEKDDN